MQITIGVATVLRQFVDDPSSPRYGYDLMQATGYPSGKLYPILTRLETAGWLTSEKEQVDTATLNRPPRRIYQLSDSGYSHAVAALEQVRKDLGGTP